MHKMGVHKAYFISQCSNASEHLYRLARAFTALALAQNGRSYGIFFQPMLRRDLVFLQSCQNLHCSHTCTKWSYIRHISSVNALTRLRFVPSSQSLHCSRTYTKWAFIWHILSANAQTRLSIPAVLPEPSLLSHMHKMGVHTAYFISQCSNASEHSYCLARAFTALAHAQNGRSYGIFFQPMLRRD